MSVPVASPCISVCTVRARDNLCTGCYRTLDEIAAWGSLGDAAKLAVLERCEQRMETDFDQRDR